MAAGDAGRAPSATAAQSLVESFCAVTSATPEEAAFFLESHNWALESAVRSFYDSADGDGDADADGPDPPPQPPPPATEDGADSDDEDYVGDGDEDDDDEDYVRDDDDEDAALAAAAAAADERRRPAKRQKRSQNARGGSGNGGSSERGNVRTLSDLGGSKKGARSDGDEDSEDEEWTPPPELYTGGEKSGMVVRDQSKRKNNADEIFKQAKRKGAKQGPFEARRQSSRSFSGTGRLLTGETVQSDAPQQQENIVHNVYFWSNGFTVDDGPLRNFDDPQNASFLESVKNSECPTELEPADGSSKVNVNLVRKKEKCPEPVKPAAPFQGGRTLGTPSDNSAPSDITSAAAASSTVTATKTMTQTVDESLPSTSLQIRFADGSRVVARFNTSHTIGDVRAFIDATRPGEGSDYTLQVGFPPKPLDDVTKTIDEAGVANSVIIRKSSSTEPSSSNTLSI